MIHRKIANYPSLRVVFSQGWDLPNSRKIQHVSLRSRPHSLWENGKCCDNLNYFYSWVIQKQETNKEALKYPDIRTYQT